MGPTPETGMMESMRAWDRLRALGDRDNAVVKAAENFYLKDFDAYKAEHKIASGCVSLLIPDRTLGALFAGRAMARDVGAALKDNPVWDKLMHGDGTPNPSFGDRVKHLAKAQAEEFLGKTGIDEMSVLGVAVHDVREDPKVIARRLVELKQKGASHLTAMFEEQAGRVADLGGKDGPLFRLIQRYWGDFRAIPVVDKSWRTAVEASGLWTRVRQAVTPDAIRANIAQQLSNAPDTFARFWASRKVATG